MDEEKSSTSEMKRENQSLMESCADLAKKKEKIQHELQSKQQYIASLEGQLQHAKQAAEAEISKVFNYYILFLKQPDTHVTYRELPTHVK